MAPTPVLSGRLLAGFKDGLRYSLTGDHIDAQEALRIGLVNQVVPADRLLDECFAIVERIALVPPETVKLNLATGDHGHADDGLQRRLDDGRAIVGGGAYAAPRRAAPAARRKKKERRHQGVLADARRAVSTGAVWAALPSARITHRRTFKTFKSFNMFKSSDAFNDRTSETT